MTVVSDLPTKQMTDNGETFWDTLNTVGVTSVSCPAWGDHSQVLLTVCGKSVIVLAEDLRKAIDNAINT